MHKDSLDSPLSAVLDNPAFLRCPGEMAELIRTFDWSATGLGPIILWPLSLKAAVDVMLRSAVPMAILWGKDGILIFNDAYSTFSGAHYRHKLGRKVIDAWPEAAAFNANVVTTVLTGDTLSYRDIEFTLQRGGMPEPVWMDLDYSPIVDAGGDPAGVMAIVRETTEKILAARQVINVQQRQHQMLQQMPGFVAVLQGPEFIYEYVNDAYIRISQRTDFLGRRFRDVFPDVAEQGFYEMLDRVYASGKSVVTRNMPMRLRGSNEEQFIDFVFEPIRDGSGAVSGLFIGGYEVTEAYRATQALKASEERLLDLNANLERKVSERTQARSVSWQVSPDLMGALNADGYFITSNPAWQTMLGWTEEDLAEHTLFDLIHPDDIAATMQAFKGNLQGSPSIRFPNRYRCKHGGYRWISWIGVPEDGMIYCTGRDITEEKLAAAERDQLWTLSEDLLARADYDGNLTAVNPAWTRLLGWSETKLLTDRYAEIIHPDNLQMVIEQLELMGQTGQPTRFENSILAADGEWRPIDWTVSPEPGGTHFIAIGRDLTEHKNREKELVRAQDALRQAHKMEAVGQLTGGIAHDFNNLLAAISGSLELLEMRINQGKFEGTERYINAAQGASRRAAALTQRLLAFSRRQTLDPRPTDCNRLVQGMEELIRRSVGPEVDLRFVSEPQLWTTLVDASQLENALLNLCINGRDAMAPQGGALVIETANRWLNQRDAAVFDLPSGAYVFLSVTDHGIGMTPEIVDKAFDPFFTTKPLGQGTGLGLSMIHGFVRQSGGQVWIHSEPQKGTTVCLHLPRSTATASAADPKPALPGGGSGQGETVLVIDDEAAVRMLMVEVLEDAGYQTLAAEDGPAGLEILRSAARIDLLVTDVGLPRGMNGRQVADAARALRPELKVLFVTGYAEKSAMSQVQLNDSLQVLIKPFPMAALSGKVRDMIGQRSDF
ncbi:PAS domain S-box protein [Halopseudomonas sp.]|jgi:PAS domain S-box-containing protein|uniref:PAS domain S-box protein n=1 Tax=Halopseudomonas sp. TaxID=2901191 RepID=UPI0039E5CE65